ncbi:CUB domain protein [Ancylostoma ceylanicum]|uniref:CUB domain protein n=1 Tax=Ancylostoma ceylanicum TaxID=53326 RepID=A0A0D6M2P5_9BILA|nr:CUB domain protein [Ancylostoma ceylanicum]
MNTVELQEFRDGRYGFSPLIGRFCGMELPMTEIRARSGFLWIRFHSDDLLEYKGFYATYDMVRSTDRKVNQHDCQIQFRHALDGYIETSTLVTGLPMNFTGPLDCIWLLEVPREYNIVLYINEFSLYAPNHCGHNFFEILRANGGTGVLIAQSHVHPLLPRRRQSHPQHFDLSALLVLRQTYA